MGRPHKCPYCGESGKSTSKGIRKTKTLGNRMIRFCKACKRKFTPRNQKSNADTDQADWPSQIPEVPAASPAGATDTPAAAGREAPTATESVEEPASRNEQFV